MSISLSDTEAENPEYIYGGKSRENGTKYERYYQCTCMSKTYLCYNFIHTFLPCCYTFFKIRYGCVVITASLCCLIFQGNQNVSVFYHVYMLLVWYLQYSGAFYTCTQTCILLDKIKYFESCSFSGFKKRRCVLSYGILTYYNESSVCYNNAHTTERLNYIDHPVLWPLLDEDHAGGLTSSSVFKHMIT